MVDFDDKFQKAAVFVVGNDQNHLEKVDAEPVNGTRRIINELGGDQKEEQKGPVQTESSSTDKSYSVKVIPNNVGRQGGF